eukprot:m51a1_g719 putative 5 -3 exoribonuclease 2 (543) ;mRNA; f:448987-450863
MGVEGLRKFLHSDRSVGVTRCSYLHIDLNDVLHACGGGDVEPVLRAICREIDDLVRLFRPTRAVVVAVDGVSPFCKTDLQRQRRFGMVRSQAGKDDRAVSYALGGTPLDSSGVPFPPPAAKRARWGPQRATEPLDSCRITPGTQFHLRLGEALRSMAAARVADRSSAAWWGLDVLVSDARSPGEGEAKIFDVLRAVVDDPELRKTAPGASEGQYEHVIVGGDGDLVLRAAAVAMHPCAPSIAVVQDCRGKRNARQVDVVVARKVADHILRLALPKGSTAASEEQARRIVRDVVGLSGLAPNDFIGKMVQTFDDVCYLYRKLSPGGGYVFSEQGELDPTRFAQLMRALAAMSPGRHHERQQPSSPLDRVCDGYANGVRWFGRYVLTGDVVSWSYCPPRVPVHAGDVARFLEHLAEPWRPSLHVGAPIQPLEHLLCVLPYSLRELAPGAAQMVIEDWDDPHSEPFLDAWLMSRQYVHDIVDQMVAEEARMPPGSSLPGYVWDVRQQLGFARAKYHFDVSLLQDLEEGHTTDMEDTKDEKAHENN